MLDRYKNKVLFLQDQVSASRQSVGWTSANATRKQACLNRVSWRHPRLR